MTDALVLVDIQYDFMPGGSLAVAGGDQVVAVANAAQRSFELVIATQDWHPPDHGSFASNHEGRLPGQVIELAGLQQILWPDHCVQGSHGAELHRDLEIGRVAGVFRKGVDREIDSYSAFFDNAHRRSTGLAEFLRERGVTAVYLLGLATDYCVKYSALDAVNLGLRTFVIEDGCRAVNLQPQDGEEALAAMRAAGVTILHSQELVSSLAESMFAVSV
jgi:nicotinamidase/pyrazinamidase